MKEKAHTHNQLKMLHQSHKCNSISEVSSPVHLGKLLQLLECNLMQFLHPKILRGLREGCLRPRHKEEFKRILKYAKAKRANQFQNLQSKL